MTTRLRPSILAASAWFAVAGLANTGGDARADSHCISSQLYCDVQETLSSDPTYLACCSNVYGFSCARYDIPAGTLRAFGGGGGSVTMRDSFHVVGPTDGTPLEFTAQLVLLGSASRTGCQFGGAGVSGRLVEGASNAADTFVVAPPCGTIYLNTTLEVQIHRLSGERFQISASVGAGGYEGGSESIDGTLRFAGLPEGASVVSCNGFHQGPPVPVARGYWGELKTRYR